MAGSGRNSHEAVTGADSGAFATRLHHRSRRTSIREEGVPFRRQYQLLTFFHAEPRFFFVTLPRMLCFCRFCLLRHVRREWALLWFHSVCLSRCLSVTAAL